MEAVERVAEAFVDRRIGRAVFKWRRLDLIVLDLVWETFQRALGLFRIRERILPELRFSGRERIAEGALKEARPPSFVLENTVVPSVVFTSTWTFKLFR